VPAESAKHRRIGDLTRTRREERREPGWDVEIGRLAETQYGVVTWRQLYALGLGKDAIQHRIATGRLPPLHRGVYAVGHRLIPREGRWMAAVLASGPDAVLSHWSAAALWMIRPNSRTRIDVTVPHRSRSSDLIRRHISEVPPDERGIEERIPVTSVPGRSSISPRPSPAMSLRTCCGRWNSSNCATVSPFEPWSSATRGGEASAG
jgi:hypothetical protein